jgi:hypothetical protein
MKNWSAKRTAKLVLFQVRAWQAGAVAKEIIGVEEIIPEEFETFP